MAAWALRDAVWLRLDFGWHRMRYSCNGYSVGFARNSCYSFLNLSICAASVSAFSVVLRRCGGKKQNDFLRR